jgi:predicted nucleic acid-binding protein
VIVVDTSVWVTFLRDARAAVRPALEQLLDEDAVLLPRPVKVELLSGAGAQTVALLQRTLGALEPLTPSADTWRLVEEWAVIGAGRGVRFGVGDLLVAACAAEHGAQLWSLDEDFEPMVQLKWIRCFRPKPTLTPGGTGRGSR